MGDKATYSQCGNNKWIQRVREVMKRERERERERKRKRKSKRKWKKRERENKTDRDRDICKQEGWARLCSI